MFLLLELKYLTIIWFCFNFGT